MFKIIEVEETVKKGAEAMPSINIYICHQKLIQFRNLKLSEFKIITSKPVI